ncbi:MAG: DUF4249 family protein [Bacteroidales bacterium]|nr:DUF4249 family protein [Bacteroidales bacterium]
MKTKYILLLTILALFIMNSCTERLEIELDETYNRLVVEANITTDTSNHFFTLSQTSSYFYNQPPPKVIGAHIMITDNLGNETTFTESGAGKYVSPDNFYGVAGRTYEIDIELEEAIGESKFYQASSDLVSVDPIDSIGVAFNANIGREGYWIIKLYATDPVGVENFYMFNVYNNGELMTDTLNKVSFTDDRLFDGNFTYGIGVAYFKNIEDDQPFKVGDTVVLEMAGLNKDQYIYLNEVIQATSFQNPMFGGPPANVKGNISNGAFGYFGSYSTTYSSLILTADNIEFEE